jgi:DNA-binding CsgD family transcriptional regulator
VGRCAPVAREAAEAFDELGSAGWAEEVRAELERVGGRRPQRDNELTPAERRVVELAANGASNKEIAQALFVSIHTVETHLTHSYAKLGLRSRAQLARRLAS